MWRKLLIHTIPLMLAAGLPAMDAMVPGIREGDLRLVGDTGPFAANWTFTEPEPGLVLATLALSSSVAANLPELSVKWDIPALGIAGVWVADNTKAKMNHQVVKVESRSVRGMPVVTYLGQDDVNRLTVAHSDPMRPSTLSGVIREEDARIRMTLQLFKGWSDPVKSHEITLRFDSRPAPFYKSLREVAQWWAAMENHTPTSVPESARVPLYSTWYSYHQHLDPEQLVAECRAGAELGLHGIIVDDGWQTLDSNRGYAFTGDWKPERLTDMRGLVDRVHALDQEFMLWYSVPMVGEKSAAMDRFKDQTLRYVPALGAHVLDPRFPEVRDYLIRIYESAVRDWALDGLKLDFLEIFLADNNARNDTRQGRDFTSVEEAVDRMMSDVVARVRAIKPDIAIEFRQPYNGPLMRKYGNMLRAVDCPNAAPVNRMSIVDLRLMADRTAVHSDMIMWHPDEPAEGAALQVLNIIFSVPQISMRLGELPDAHREMLGFWMKYWMANRDVLLDGEFQPVAPALNYPLVVGRDEGKLIAAVYQDMFVSPGSGAPPQLDVINAKPGRDVVLRFAEPYGEATVRILDTRGVTISEEMQSLGAGAHAWKVPPSGLLEIRRASAE